MKRLIQFVALMIVCAGVVASSNEKEPSKKPADGVYLVKRESLTEREVLPIKDGEVLLVDRNRYAKKPDAEPARYIVVGKSPDVLLELAEAPKSVKDGDEVVKIFVKLQEKPAKAMEKLTREHEGKHVTIVLGGDVVTTHKIRTVIKGDVQITSCTPGAATYLLDQLQKHVKAN